jgi:hypothetical protein
MKETGAQAQADNTKASLGVVRRQAEPIHQHTLGPFEHRVDRKRQVVSRDTLRLHRPLLTVTFDLSRKADGASRRPTGLSTGRLAPLRRR